MRRALSIAFSPLAVLPLSSLLLFFFFLPFNILRLIISHSCLPWIVEEAGNTRKRSFTCGEESRNARQGKERKLALCADARACTVEKAGRKYAPSVCLFSHFLEEEHRGALLFLSFFGTDAGMLGYELTGVFLWLMACSL